MIKDISNRNKEIKPTSHEMELLHKDFANCFNNEGKFDITRFKAAISDKVDLINESQGFEFLGKSYARMLASMESTTVIIPDDEHNRLPENINSKNIYISGDNLDALKHLANSYAGKVKCIYIDPPYNTGEDGFVYNDKFNFTKEELAEKLNIEEEQAERIIGYNDGNTRSDAAWLTFMLPRLLVAKEMLKDDGVIFISIDDNEQANLKMLCDEIFGVENFEGNIHWRRRSNQPNDKTKLIGIVAEHILVYTRNSEYLKQVGVGKIPLTGKFSNPDHDPRGDWASKAWKTGSGQSGTRYIITSPKGVELDEEWMGEENTYNCLVKDKRIVWPQRGDGMPRKKYFKSERLEEGQCASNWWPSDVYGNNQDATDELATLFDGRKNVFSNPKPTTLLKNIIMLANVKENEIIMDFFSGSGTTADAMFQSDIDDMFNRYFILVQINENLDQSFAHSTGKGKDTIKNSIDFLSSINKPHRLDEIGMERIRRAAKRTKDANPLFHGDLGFKHFTLKELPEETVDKLDEFKPLDFVGTDETLKLMGGKEAVLATWLCDDGYKLDAPVEHTMLGGYTAYYMDKHLYLIDGHFDEKAMGALMEKYDRDSTEFHPSSIVVFGYSFSTAEMLMLRKNIPALRDNESGNNINIDVRY
jgi:adenine specific DNA methylase Mod